MQGWGWREGEGGHHHFRHTLMDKSKDSVLIIGYYVLDAPGMRAELQAATDTCLKGTHCSQSEETPCPRLPRLRRTAAL